MSEKVYCKYCGSSSSSISGLTSGSCSKNPEGKKHVPYEGDEKSNTIVCIAEVRLQVLAV